MFQSPCLLLHLQLQVQKKSVMSCVMTHLLTSSVPPLFHGRVILKYNYEKCSFLSGTFNSSSCLLHTHIIYWLEADQYAFWLFSYNALLQTILHLVFNLWYTKSHFLHILRTNVFEYTHYQCMLLNNWCKKKCSFVSLTSWMRHVRNSVIPPLNVECPLLVALKVILVHVQNIIRSRILQSVFQKSSMAHGPEHKAYVSLYFILAGVSYNSHTSTTAFSQVDTFIKSQGTFHCITCHY